MKCKDIVAALELLSNPAYACDWDNVGLLVGSREHNVNKILVSLDCDNRCVEKAVEVNADMIVTHHPIIFAKMNSVTDDSLTGNKVLRLISNNIAGYSMHTNFDVSNMAALFAQKNGVSEIRPLEVMGIYDGIEKGIGCIGTSTPKTVGQWCEQLKTILKQDRVVLYGNKDMVVDKIAIVPGSGKDYIKMAFDEGARLLITGDINHHSGIDAVDMGMNVIDASHYGTEYIFVEFIKNYLINCFSDNVEVIGMEQNNPFSFI